MTYEQLDAAHKAIMSRIEEAKKLSKYCQGIRDRDGMVAANATYATLIGIADGLLAAMKVTRNG